MIHESLSYTEGLFYLFWNMIAPPFLKPGDRIGIVATARKINPEDIQAARQIFESWGLVVVLSPYLFSDKHAYLAGDDQQRLAGIQDMLNDPTINAIISARGGYGTTRIVDDIDFTAFQNHPKWVVGFSDITALHLNLTSIGIQSIHGVMPILFDKEDAKESIESLRNILFGNTTQIIASHDVNNRPGKAIGPLIGGNLSLLVDALGTKHEPDTSGKILVIEEIDEYLYKVDRMMVQLKRSGKLENLAALIAGHFTDIKESTLSFGETFQDIIRYHTREYHFPIAFKFPIGHEQPNLAWIEGANSNLLVASDHAELTML